VTSHLGWRRLRSGAPGIGGPGTPLTKPVEAVSEPCKARMTAVGQWDRKVESDVVVVNVVPGAETFMIAGAGEVGSCRTVIRVYQGKNMKFFEFMQTSTFLWCSENGTKAPSKSGNNTEMTMVTNLAQNTWIRYLAPV